MKEPQKLYYIDPQTGEYKEDKRNTNNKVEYTLSKISITIDTLEKSVESRLSMFQDLLSERLGNACKDIDDVQEETGKIVQHIEKMIETNLDNLVKRQIKTDEHQDIRLLKIERRVNEHSSRIKILEDKPIVSKAKVYDKIAVGVGSLIAGYIAANLMNIINFFIGAN